MEKIEVGDTFTLKKGGSREYVCTNGTEHFIDAKDVAFSRERCRLVRKANHYAGLTLPTPPAGYRLAKWGEEHKSAMYWTDTRWSFWGNLCAAAYSIPDTSIFAVPVDQPASTAPMSWQFRHDPWVIPQPKTLADVRDNTDCIVALSDSNPLCYVMFRCGQKAFFRLGHGADKEAIGPLDDARFVRYLDPPQSAPLRLEDVPDGRVIQCSGRWHWKVGATWWRSDGGGVWPNMVPRFGAEFTVTDYIAEFE